VRPISINGLLLLGIGPEYRIVHHYKD